MKPISKHLGFWLGVAACVISVGCAGANRESSPPEVDSASRWVEDALASLSMEQKIGQMIYPRSDGLFVNESDARYRRLTDAARAGRIGGVVFFKGDPFETAAAVNRLQELSQLPLLIASDYEWGVGMRVRRASGFPMAMAMGAGASREDVEYQAEVTAREARALGVRLLLNPVLDLNTNPRNSVINTRSFGEDPERASELGVAYIRRAQDLGVLTTAKHFPGHGATEADSHLRLPLVELDGARLRAVELQPFQAAIDAGVAAVMTAHVAVPGLGGPPDVPATLSPEILQGVLRHELGFEGLIVSDALDMGGAREGAWDGEVAVAAVNAGVDMLLVPPDALVTHAALVRAVRQGRIEPTRIDAAVRRILEAKARLDLHRNRTVSLDDLPLRLSEPSTARRIDAIADKTLTVVRDEPSVLPLTSGEELRLLLVELVPDGDLDIDAEVLFTELRRRAARVRRLRWSPRFAASNPEIAPEPGEVVILASYARARYLVGAGNIPSHLADAAARLAEDGTPLIFASFGNPFVLNAVPQASTLVATYDESELAQRAFARALFGESPVGGRLPVTLSPEYPRGHGVQVAHESMRLMDLESPESVGMSSEGLKDVVDLLRNAVEDRATPGGVALVARRGRVVLEAAFGHLTYDDDSAEVTPRTMYDLASLTKVIVTTTLSMMMVERELLDLKSPVHAYVPEFRGPDKDRVLIEDLLAHSGGLLWWTELFKRFEGQSPEAARRGYVAAIAEMPLDFEPRSKMVYSDLGILLLGEILERVTGKPLDVLAAEEIFEPLGMNDTLFRPGKDLLPRIAPTEEDPWRGRVVHGEVHDENAYGLGGLAPHAGLFATARSLAPFAQMLLNGGAYGGKRLLNGATIDQFTQRAELVPGSSRALGWDTPSEPSSAGALFSATSFGHTGFTGTSIWIDPERELFAILLTNRVHPTRDNRKIYDVRPLFHDAVMRAIVDEEIRPRTIH